MTELEGSVLQAFDDLTDRLAKARAAMDRRAFRQAEVLLDATWWDVRRLSGLVRSAKRAQQRIEEEQDATA